MTPRTACWASTSWDRSISLLLARALVLRGLTCAAPCRGCVQGAGEMIAEATLGLEYGEQSRPAPCSVLLTGMHLPVSSDQARRRRTLRARATRTRR